MSSLPTGRICAPSSPAASAPAWNDSTAGVVSDGANFFCESRTPLSNGVRSGANAIAHGTRIGAVPREPIWIAPSAGGAAAGMPANDALIRIVISPWLRSLKRSGEAWSSRPAPPVWGTATRRDSRREDTFRIVSFWTLFQFLRSTGPNASAVGSVASSPAAAAPTSTRPLPWVSTDASSSGRA